MTSLQSKWGTNKWGWRKNPLLWDLFHHGWFVFFTLLIAIGLHMPLEYLFKGSALVTVILGILCLLFGFRRML